MARSELENQAVINAERLSKDMAAGLNDLLELHNSEEMKILCRTLGALGKGPQSKRANIDRIFKCCIHNDDDDYQKVLKAVWDGIIIEYLRGIGKNLMRCKDNLRAAVIKHWRRHCVFKVEGRGERPVFVNNTKWTRDSNASETDSIVKQQLEELQAVETEWKASERRLRVNADYSAVVDYLTKVYQVRRMEEKVRDYLLGSLQKVLNQCDESVEAEKRAKDDMRKAQSDLVLAMRDIRTKESFHATMLSNFTNSSTVEKIHWGVNRIQLNNIILDLKQEIAAREAAHEAERQELLLRIDGLKEEARQTQIKMDELNARAEKHAGVVNGLSLELEKTTSERDFLLQRCTDYNAYIKKMVALSAFEQVKKNMYFTISAAKSATSLSFHRKADYYESYSARRAEESERWQMTCAEVEAKYLPKIKIPKVKKKKGKGKKGRRSKSASKKKRPTTKARARPTSRGKSKGPDKKGKRGASTGPSRKKSEERGRSPTRKDKTKGKKASKSPKKKSKSPTKKKRK